MLADLLVPPSVANPDTLPKIVNSFPLTLVGVPTLSEELIERFLSSVAREVVLVPRYVHESTSTNPLPPKSALRSALPLCVPDSVSTARLLAKVRSSIPIALCPQTLRFVDETQVNFMATSRVRKFVEVLLGEFLELCKRVPKPKMSFERALYFMTKAIDRALYLDVGVIVSSGRQAILHPKQMKAILYSLGYTKRERLLMTALYPLELLRTWLKGGGRG